MDQSRKRRSNNRKSGLSQFKVARVDETEDVPEGRDALDTTGSNRQIKTIRTSSPLSDCTSQDQDGYTQMAEDDAEKNLIIMLDKEQGGPRAPGRRKALRKKKDMFSELEAQQKEVENEIQPEVEIDQELDRELENKSRQHNLTSANVRSIIHEVITNEHVVAMMKAAISETEPIPVFEPKMTRSKLKEVVEKGVVIPTWNISPIKKPTEVKRGPQFVDIPLEEEDSSDEEYRPDEEEEDEMAEETLLESDFENSSSSPRVSRVNIHKSLSEHDEDRASNSRLILRRSRHLTVAAAPMGPPPPPQDPSRAPPDCSFLEKLHAVDEELAIGPECMESYQSLSSGNGEESLISFRTRSKRPLRDVPLGRLEAELRAPDITPDMYEFGSAPEDREWTQWLQGLMSSDMDNEEDGDDEDDPEYNFLADIDEPDVEDYRNDKAVRITKKEVNDLMEELFDAFQDDLGVQEEEGHEEEEEKEAEETEETPLQEPPGILENIQYEDPLADVLKQRYRTVREQLAAVRKRKALLESKGVSVPACPQPPSNPITSMTLNAAQKQQLQQQIQQHVQLLTQVNMLCRSVEGLETELSTSRQFLLELQMFAQRGESVCGAVERSFTSVFKACNLQGAISLLEELDQSPKRNPTVPSTCFPGCQFPAPLAWLMVTRPVFLYPELLPTVQLRPSKFKRPFTSAEDCLAVLGHKHLRSTLNPLQMTCRYLLAARSFDKLKVHIRDAFQKPFPNVIKTYFMTGKCPPMPLACKRLSPCDQRPPVEREHSLMPNWLLKNLSCIYQHVRKFNQQSEISQTTNPAEEATDSPVTLYPPSIPMDLAQTLPALPLGPCKQKRHTTAQSTKPSKSIQTAEELKVLNQLPTLLPKAVTLSHDTHFTLVLRPETNPCLSRNRAVVTSPTVPIAPKLSSSKTDLVKNAVETPMGVSGSQRGVSATQRDMIITLPAAMTPDLNYFPSGHKTATHTAQIVTSNVAPAIAGTPNLIITLQPSPVANSLICPTPIIKTNVPSPKVGISQHYDTLLKPKSIDSGGLDPVCQKPLNCVLLLPQDNVFACSNFGHQKGEENQTLTESSSPNYTGMNLRKQQGMPDISHSPNGSQEGPTDMSSIQGTLTDCFQEIIVEEELNDDDGETVEIELEEDGEDPRELILTLSESSGSPTPSIEEEDVETEMEKEKLDEQKAKEEGDRNSVTWEEETGGVSDVLFVPKFQEAMEKFSHLSTKTISDCSDDVESKHQPSGYSDSPDDDPYRDAKDVAFAQAYLEKVYEVLHTVPGKVDEFLCILSEFEKDPECHTSLELLKRLKPVLDDWPELLRDFAAFLNPDQARECGLLAEQQAFERSRRFLRHLERTFGEQSELYRKVMHILQRGPSSGLADFKEMKAQISLLFCDHTDLLEEFWQYFKQLYPQVQDEDHSLKGSQPDKKIKPVKTAIYAQITGIKKNKVKKNRAELDEEAGASSVDIQRSSIHATGSSVCAKNISHTPTGKKVVLWTREADRVILTTCQQRGAKTTTFHAIAAQLGNKTANEVLERYQYLMKLFQKSSKSHLT